MNIFYYFPDHYKYIIQIPRIITLHIFFLELLKELTKMEIKGYIVALIMAMTMMELASLTLATSRRSMLTNGIGLTPPMGYVVFLALFSFIFLISTCFVYPIRICRWNSWNHFGCDIDEKMVKETGKYSISNHIYAFLFEIIFFSFFFKVLYTLA